MEIEISVQLTFKLSQEYLLFNKPLNVFELLLLFAMTYNLSPQKNIKQRIVHCKMFWLIEVI